MDQHRERGKKFPASNKDELSNKVISLSALRKLSYKEIDDVISRAVFDHWPQYRVDCYKEILLRYMGQKSLSPQKLYDQIMEPEIRARRRDYQARHGVALSVVEARPNPGDNGRDLIRKWLHKPDGTVSRGFLRYVRRFIIKNSLEILDHFSASQTVLDKRRNYHSKSLNDIGQSNFFIGPLRELFDADEVYYFYLKQGRSILAGSDQKILSLQFHETGIGYFLIYKMPKVERDAPIIGALSSLNVGLALEYQGYFWAPQPRLDTPEEEIELHVISARKFTRTTSMPPCHPYLLSKEVELKLFFRFDSHSEDGSTGFLAVPLRELNGGEITISGSLFPEIYEMTPIVIPTALAAHLKKLEGIQINV